MSRTHRTNPNITTALAEQIAEYKGTTPNSPEFCLYEDTDPEALELLFEGTDGPLKTQIRIDDTSVTIERTIDRDISVAVEPAENQQHASD